MDGRGMQDFRLEPRVSERTDSNTFVVCEAIQVNPLFHNIRVSNGKAVFEFQKVPGSDDVVKGTPVQRQLNLFYPPQVKILTTAGAKRMFCCHNILRNPTPRIQNDQKWSQMIQMV